MTQTQQYVVMVVGILLAVAGVALLFYGRSDVGATSVKVAGVELELSAPAVVVVLAGSALLVAPFLLPVAEGATTRDPTQPPGVDGAGLDAGAQASEECDDGLTYTVQAHNARMDGDDALVTLRWTNPGAEVLKRSAYNAPEFVEPHVSDGDGEQLELVDSWEPPRSLGPKRWHEGRLRVKADGDEPPSRLLISVGAPYDECDGVTVGVDV